MLFAQAEWPSAASNSAGRSGTSRSSSVLLGLASGKTVSSQPAPRTQGAVGRAAAQARIESAIGRGGREGEEGALAELHPAGEQVNVTVLEAGQHHLAGQVHHLGFGPDQAAGTLSPPT